MCNNEYIKVSELNYRFKEELSRSENNKMNIIMYSIPAEEYDRLKNIERKFNKIKEYIKSLE